MKLHWIGIVVIGALGLGLLSATGVLAQTLDPFALTHWRLVAFDDDPNDPWFAMNNRRPLTLEFLTGGEAGGYAGCNGFNVHYAVEDDRISFDVWFQTHMACLTQLPPLLRGTDTPGEAATTSLEEAGEVYVTTGPRIMGREEAYLDALRAATRYTLDGDRLTIVYGEGQTLVYTRVRQWELGAYGAADDPTPVIEGSQITLEFGSYENLTGFGGCNRYGARGGVGRQGAIGFREIVSTEIACAASELMDQEQAYFAALEAATDYAYSGSQLVIGYGDGQQLIFQQADPLAGTAWKLVSYGMPDDPAAAITNNGVTLAFGEDGRATGSGGCNSFGGSYAVDGDRIQFGEIVSTLMACVDTGVMDQEQAYFAALNSVTAYTLDGDQLTITYGEGQQLVLEQVDPLAGTQWTLTAYGAGNDPTPVSAGSSVTLSFGQDRQVTGSGGCNTYRGGYGRDGETLRFGAILSTRMACTDADLTAQEQAYFAALEAATRYTVAGDRLTITYGDGQQLVFQALTS